MNSITRLNGTLILLVSLIFMLLIGCAEEDNPSGPDPVPYLYKWEASPAEGVVNLNMGNFSIRASVKNDEENVILPSTVYAFQGDSVVFVYAEADGHFTNFIITPISKINSTLEIDFVLKPRNNHFEIYSDVPGQITALDSDSRFTRVTETGDLDLLRHSISMLAKNSLQLYVYDGAVLEGWSEVYAGLIWNNDTNTEESFNTTMFHLSGFEIEDEMTFHYYTFDVDDQTFAMPYMEIDRRKEPESGYYNCYTWY